MTGMIDVTATSSGAVPVRPAASSWRAPVVAAVSTCVAVSTVYMTQPILTQIAGSLHVGAESARFVFTVASFAYALAFFLFGPLSDRFQARTLGSAGALAVAMLIAVSTVVSSFAVFALALAVAGVAAAAVPAAMIALMPRIAPEGMGGVYFGLIIGATVAGITLGRLFTGVVAQWTDWHVAVLLLAALNVLMFLAARRLPVLNVPAKASRSVGGAYVASLRMFGQFAVVGSWPSACCCSSGTWGSSRF